MWSGLTQSKLNPASTILDVFPYSQQNGRKQRHPAPVGAEAIGDFPNYYALTKRLFTRAYWSVEFEGHLKTKVTTQR